MAVRAEEDHRFAVVAVDVDERSKKIVNPPSDHFRIPAKSLETFLGLKTPAPVYLLRHLLHAH